MFKVLSIKQKKNKNQGQIKKKKKGLAKCTEHPALEVLKKKKKKKTSPSEWQRKPQQLGTKNNGTPLPLLDVQHQLFGLLF